MAATVLEKLLGALGAGGAGHVLRKTGAGADAFEMAALPMLKAATGHVELPGGIVLQWGNGTATANGATTVNMGRAFTSGGYACFTALKHPVSVHADPLGADFDGLDKIVVTNAYTADMAFFWWAVGA